MVGRMNDRKLPSIPRILRTTSTSRRPRGVPPGFELVKLYRGHHLLLPRDCPPWQRAREVSLGTAVAASSTSPRVSIVSHESAAVLWGLWLWNAPEFGHVMADSRFTNPRHALLKRHALPAGRTFVEVQGVRVTSSAHTVLDCARAMASDELFVLLASALRSRVGLGELRQLIADSPRRQGVPRLADMVEWCPANCDSPLEAYCLWFALALGLPTPETQYRVVVGSRAYWLDLAWPKLRVAVELDGQVKYTSDEAWFAEKRRQDDLNNAGWRIIRLKYADLRAPGKLRALLLGAVPREDLADIPHSLLDAQLQRAG